jgi:hypothetical protein
MTGKEAQMFSETWNKHFTRVMNCIHGLIN